jgi:hypothetical protein
MISQMRLERFEDEAVYTLTVDYSNPSVGGFKTAHKGRVEASPFCSKTVDVCVKQGHQFDKNCMFLHNLYVIHRLTVI